VIIQPSESNDFVFFDFLKKIKKNKIISLRSLFFRRENRCNELYFCPKLAHLGLICHQKMTKKRLLLRKKRLKNAGFTSLLRTFATLLENTPIIQLICI
jgi:hypothetical protein